MARQRLPTARFYRCQEWWRSRGGLYVLASRAEFGLGCIRGSMAWRRRGHCFGDDHPHAPWMTNIICHSVSCLPHAMHPRLSPGRSIQGQYGLNTRSDQHQSGFPCHPSSHYPPCAPLSDGHKQFNALFAAHKMHQANSFPGEHIWSRYWSDGSKLPGRQGLIRQVKRGPAFQGILLTRWEHERDNLQPSETVSRERVLRLPTQV